MDTDQVVDLARLRILLRSGAARSVRLGAHLSLREFGTALNVSQSTVWRWEQGQRTPRGEAALRYWSLLQRLMGGNQ